MVRPFPLPLANFHSRTHFFSKLLLSLLLHTCPFQAFKKGLATSANSTYPSRYIPPLRPPLPPFTICFNPLLHREATPLYCFFTRRILPGFSQPYDGLSRGADFPNPFEVKIFSHYSPILVMVSITWKSHPPKKKSDFPLNPASCKLTRQHNVRFRPSSGTPEQIPFTTKKKETPCPFAESQYRGERG